MPIGMVISKGRVPVKCWTPSVEHGAIEQAINLANLPFAFKHVALMPDTHQGYGMPIGGVLATDGVVIPNAVGVDIGCGMCAVKTTIQRSDVADDTIHAIMNDVRAVVPVGRNHHQQAQAWGGFLSAPDTKIIRDEVDSAYFQLGTLGGGNHFIELQQDTDGFLWFMIHSGSRNIGKKVADHYNAIAEKLNAAWHVGIPPSAKLAFLPVESKEGSEYLESMRFCTDFALENRRVMMMRAVGALDARVGACHVDAAMIYAHHNYAVQEHHFGKNVWVHRKGAICAREGMLGIIPGSMGTSSYIVRGLGNEQSFTSASHGAGRTMSRSMANQTFTEDDATAAMGSVIFDGWHGDVSESPLAYKDIDEVMANQTDLVEIVTRLTPVAVVKG